MAWEFLTNQIKNFSDKQTKDSLKYLNIFSINQSKTVSNNTARKATSTINRSSYTIKLQNKKRSKISTTKTNQIINDTIAELTTLHFDAKSTYADVINTCGVSLIDDITTSINNNIATKTAAISGLPQNIIDGLYADGVNQINAAISSIQAAAGVYIQNFATDMNKKLAVYENQAKSLSKLLGKKIPSFDVNLLTGKTTKYDFGKRDKGNSSISRYAQANVPTKAGKLLPNKDILTKTPDAKILIPQLKIDTNIVKTFSTLTLPKLPTMPSLASLIPQVPTIPAMPSMPAIPSLPTAASLQSMVSFSALGAKLGFSPGLIPTDTTKKIEEPKPTPNKAEYGKIQVKETKGGFVEINDDTPGNVRKIVQHPSGTYNSMLDDGSVHTKATGNKQEIIDGDWNIKTEGDKVEIVSGDCKIEIRKNVKENITGNKATFIEGEQSTIAKKTVSNDFKDNYEEKVGGDFTSSVAGNRKEKTDGNLEETVTGNHKETTTGNFTIKVTGNVNINSSGNTTVNSTGPATLSSDTVVKITAPAVKIG